MRVLLIIILLIPVFGFSQTKQETIQWLTETFGKKDHFDGIFNSYTVLKIKDDGSFIKDVKSYSPANNRLIASNTFSGNFKNFGLNSIYSKEIKGTTYIYASCHNKGNCIKYKNYNPDGNLAMEREDDSMLLAIVEKMDDKSLVERSKKAFNYLIKISGGKKEVF
jgi:hypothetical protein